MPAELLMEFTAHQNRLSFIYSTILDLSYSHTFIYSTILDFSYSHKFIYSTILDYSYLHTFIL